MAYRRFQKGSGVYVCVAAAARTKLATQDLARSAAETAVCVMSVSRLQDASTPFWITLTKTASSN